MRSLLLKIVLRLLHRELLLTKPVILSKDQYDGLLSQLWQNPAFRKYVSDRDAKIIFAMAGGEGLKPEPRDVYALHAGQRVENLVLAREAKAAWGRVEVQNQKKVALESVAKKDSPQSPA